MSCIAIAAAPQSVFPKIELARVEIFAEAGNLDSESVRSKIAVPLREALASLPSLRTTRTYATLGKLELELDFDPATRPEDDRRAVDDAIAALRDQLPVSRITTVVEGPQAEPVVTYAFTSRSTSQSHLARLVRAAVPQTFAAMPQLGRTTVFAGPDIAYEVVPDTKKLASDRVSPDDLARAIDLANGPRVAGDITRAGERLSVVTGAALRSAGDIGAVGIDTGSGAVVPLRSLAQIRYGELSTGTQASFDATHAVVLNVYPVPNGDATLLARAVAERLPRLIAQLPGDTHVTVAWDQTRLIDASQRALRLEMIVGAAIALLVIAWFLRDLALTLVAAVVLPVALAITIAILVVLGFRLDLMTLGGLAIAIGLIVDEIIIVLEAIARGPTTARAVRRIARPLIASTAANAVVFLPLAFLSGVPGSFFRALAATVVVALVVSIGLSLVLAPSLVSALRARTRTSRPVDPLERAYGGVLTAALRRPAIVYGITAVLVIASVVVLVRIPSDFLPSLDEGQFEIAYALPPGMSVAAADALTTNFERAILLDRAVAHVTRLSGVDTNGYVATPPDAGTLRVVLAPGRKRESFDRIADRMRDDLANLDPYTAVEVHQLIEDQINDLSGAPEPIQLLVRGPDQRELVTIAGKIADIVTTVSGVVDTFDGVTYEPRSVRAEPASSHTPASAAFAAAVRARVSGIPATTIASPAGDIPVRVRILEPPLDRIAKLGPPALVSTVQEEDGSRIVRVTAEIESGNLSTIEATIEHRIAPIVAALPPGYRVDAGGTIAAQRRSFAEFGTIAAIALAFVLGVLIATFDSFRLPIAVLAAIPTMLPGVALVLAATATPLNVSSLMGMLLLGGIAVRSGILLVESANRRRREGASPDDAIAAAGRERLRPILMTTLAAIGAIAPLAFGLGAGSEFERPLAIAVIGGIVTATALTLFIVPALYVAISPKRA